MANKFYLNVKCHFCGHDFKVDVNGSTPDSAVVHGKGGVQLTGQCPKCKKRSTNVVQ